MTIGQLQEHVKELSAAQGWKQRTPESHALFLVSEVGELAREVLSLPDSLTIGSLVAHPIAGSDLFSMTASP